MSDGKQLDYEEESAGQQQISRDAGSDLPLKEGAVFGIVGVVITYLTHLYLTVAQAGQTTPVSYTDDGSTVVTDLVSSWVAAGWSFLGTFGVSFEAGGERAALGSAPNNVAALANGSAPFVLADTILFIVTVGTLVGLGYGVARYTDAEGPVEAVKAGLTIVPPYIVFAALAAFVMTHEYSDPQLISSVVNSVAPLTGDTFFNNSGEVVSNLTFKPSLNEAILFAGIIFPALFAVLGAIIAQGEDVIDTAVAKVNER
ncbi:hypothetical protein [Natrinema halophilum]|uniref:DUF7978 domain-containing protein n=1 Tax=Natrinema halophilum TaxID=1699371 RepID=A0A7D5GP08_9EURY|nr:hypothetical protein [Natrinema halophilum]QLG49873.1 hypothetical protein HYG82_13910 [Natrinema halophilum]